MPRGNLDLCRSTPLRRARLPNVGPDVGRNEPVRLFDQMSARQRKMERKCKGFQISIKILMKCFVFFRFVFGLKKHTLPHKVHELHTILKMIKSNQINVKDQMDFGQILEEKKNLHFSFCCGANIQVLSVRM